MDNLAEAMEITHLSDRHEEPQQLQFRPKADSGIAETVLKNIPRYLFRVASPRSNGDTNEIWVRSESAHWNKSSSTEDIFSNLDCKKRTEIAQALNLHLRWLQNGGNKDNFVSWTSSLLFAIQFIYYRHLSAKDRSCLAEIKLYIIDTRQFLSGTFIRDLDLIDAFCVAENSLSDFRSMRNRPNYYFGEYLSQGSLKIENKCQVIPANILFEQDRLRRIQPEFAEFAHIRRHTVGGKPPWVKEVNRLRNTLQPGNKLPILPENEMSGRLQAIEEIIKYVASGWRYPIAIYFAALIGSESFIEGQETSDDNLFFNFFRPASLQSASFRFFQEKGQGCLSKSFQSIRENKEEFRPSKFNVIAPDTMPELKQVKKLVHEIHKRSQSIMARDPFPEGYRRVAMEQLLETTRTVIGRMTVFGAAFNVSTVLKNTRNPRASQSGPSLAASSPTSASAMRSGASGTRAKIEKPIPKGDESDVEFIADDTDTKEAGVVDANDNNSLRPSEGMSMLSESQATSRRESVLSADVPKKKKKSKKKGRLMKHDENGNKVPLTDQEVKEYMNYVNSLGENKEEGATGNTETPQSNISLAENSW